jgi:serine/threonine-protein kinase
MAYEIFGGRTPFAGRSVQATLAAHMIEAPESLSKLRATVPPAVAALVMRCLEKRPADRPQSASEIITILDNNIGSSGGIEAVDGSRKGRYRRIAAVFGALCAIVLAIVIGRLLANGAGGAARAERSVAVMPLTNGDTAIEYLSTGIADEVRSQLTTTVQGLRVMSASSSNAYRGRPIEAAEVGKRLHVSYVVLGEMRRSHGGVHVTAELVNTADGSTPWNGSFDRGESDVSSLPDSITRAIARALKLSPNESVPGANRPAGTSNPAAYDLYLRARYLADKRGAAELVLAAQLAQQAIDLDPKFARAYAELGIATGLRSAYSDLETRVMAARAVRAEEHAIALDSTLADAWAARGFWLQPTLRWDEAERSLRHAIALDPRYTLGHKWLGQVLATLGRSDEAVEECRIATQLDPLLATTWDTYAKVLSMAGSDSAAFDAAGRALELNPAMKSPHWWRALVDLHRGQKQAALDEIAQDTVSAYPGDVGMWGYIRAMAGRRDVATATIRRLEVSKVKSAPEMAGAGAIYLGLGDNDKALDNFIRASGSGSADLSIMMGGVGSPMLDPLRANPRFGELLRVMNLQDQPVARLRR